MSADAGVRPVPPYSKEGRSAEFSMPYLQVSVTGERWEESGSSAVLSNFRPDETSQLISKPRLPSRKTKAVRPPALSNISSVDSAMSGDVMLLVRSALKTQIPERFISLSFKAKSFISRRYE